MKHLLKRLLIPLLTQRPVNNLATWLFGSGVPVFMLHRMSHEAQPGSGRTDADHLRRCLDYLAENDYTFISLEHLLLSLRDNEMLPPRSVAFTIDDGYIDQAEIAASIFLEYNCPVTFFVITGMLDQNLWPWDAQVSWMIESMEDMSLKTSITDDSTTFNLENKSSRRQARRQIQDAIKGLNAQLVPETIEQLVEDTNVKPPLTPPSSYQPIDWDMARQLESKGIRFAPHSVSHNIMSQLSEEMLKKEIESSWHTIEKELANPLKVFCYPSGRSTDFGSREIAELRDSGFLGAVASTPGFVQPENNPTGQLFQLPRLALPESMNDFIQYCTWIEYVKHNLNHPHTTTSN